MPNVFPPERTPRAAVRSKMIRDLVYRAQQRASAKTPRACPPRSVHARVVRNNWHTSKIPAIYLGNLITLITKDGSLKLKMLIILILEVIKLKFKIYFNKSKTKI